MANTDKAGLFSAVATAFVIESYQQLQPDNTAYTAVALYILVSATNHSTGINLPPPPDLQYSSPLARWINGLWFTSIMLSLIVALLSILVKQWIGEYRARNLASAKSPRDWAHRREVYSQALHTWPVAELVALLPIMLHLSLFLFFAGIIAFLWTLDMAIGILVIALGSLLAVFYLGCTLIPVWIPQCPTSTPLVHQVRRLVLSVELLALRACSAALPLASRVRDRIVPQFLIRQRQSEPATSLKEAIEQLTARRHERNQIAEQMQKRKEELSISALRWVIFEVSDSDAVAVGIQSLGALHPSSAIAEGLRHLPLDGQSCFTRSAVGPSVSEAIRATRSEYCMASFQSCRDRWRGINEVLNTSWYPDALALCDKPYDFGNHTSFPTLTSSIIRVMWAFRLGRSDFLQLLALCDFQRFASADWDIVLDSIPTATRDDLEGFSMIRCSEELRPHYLAQWVAETFQTLHEARDKRSAARAIYHLVREYSHGGALWELLRRSGRLTTIPPSVMKVLAMPVNDPKLDADDLLAALAGLNEAVDYKRLEDTYWTALSCILARFSKLSDETHAPWMACIKAVRAWEGRESPETAYAILHGVLFPNPASGAHLSVWTMLRRMDFGPRGLNLTICIANVLRTYITGPGPSAASDSPPFIDFFFAELDPRDFVAALAATWLQWGHGEMPFIKHAFKGDPVELVRRCSELRPEWWDAVRDYAGQSTSQHERDLVLAIEKVMGSA